MNPDDKQKAIDRLNEIKKEEFEIRKGINESDGRLSGGDVKYISRPQITSENPVQKPTEQKDESE